MAILVTGAAGFIGYHVSRRLLERGDTVIPASPFPAAAGAAEPGTRVTSGRRLPGSSAKPRPNGCLARTCRGTSGSDFPRSSASYGEWATGLKRGLNRRLKQVRATKGQGYFCWPTPTASNNGNLVEFEIGPEKSLLHTRLDMAANQVGLIQAARAWTSLWIVLKAAGWRARKAYPRLVCRSSPPLHLSFQLGTRCSPGTLICNPRFWEWIMGWPIGWTDCTVPVTAFALWLRHARGKFSERSSKEI